MTELPCIFLFSSNQFLIPDIEGYNSSYHRKYQLALINDGELFINEIGGFFSRIHKRNGCHRYYITHIKEELASSLDDGEHIFYKFSSVYLGTDLEAAMRTFLSEGDFINDDGDYEDNEDLYEPYFNNHWWLCRKMTPINTARFKKRTD
jgi:hypothetical protein